MADISHFKGKVIWITGASSGIGEALSLEFARGGSRLILSARREAELHRVADLCRDAESVTILPLDLSRPETMAAAVNEALGIAGRIDVMVHNAGVSQRAFAADTTFHVDERIMRTNYLGPVALTKALLPSMIAKGEGHFVVVTSVLGKVALPGRSAYCASKHALHGFFDTFRAELEPRGIHVTLIMPGWVRTNVSINALSGDGVPHGKMGAGTATGFAPDVCAKRIIAGAAARKTEVPIVRLQEIAALYLSRFVPFVFRRVIRGRPI